MFFLLQILLIVTNYNFSPTDYTDWKDFFLFFFLIRLFRLCLKRRSADLHRFFIAARCFFSHKFNKLYFPQIAQIFVVRFLFEEGAVAPMGEWHHGVGGLGEVGDELLGVVE